MPDPRPILPEALLRTLDVLVEVLNDRGADYALIGGLGTAIRGPIRSTRDIDIMLSVPQIELSGLLEALADRGFQIDLQASIQSWAQEHLLDMAFGQVRVDCIKAVLPVFQQMLKRAAWEDFGNRKIRVADAESLILMKLIAFRPRDQEDVRGILATNRGHLDLAWVRQQWAELSEPDDERTTEFERWVEEVYKAD